MMKKDDTPPSLVVTRPEGSVSFSKKELQRYSMLFTMLDHDSDANVGGKEGALFLRRSGLSEEALREVWRNASGGRSSKTLSKEQWLVACKVVAAVQWKEAAPAIASIVGAAALPLANFHYDQSAEIAVEALPEIPPTAVGVRVANPTTFSSGFSRHTRYQVLTTAAATMAQFPRSDMNVWRRFSDFEWLHTRLTVTFPAAIIPLFPEKRMMGNTVR